MNAHSHARHNVGLIVIISGLLFLLLAPSAFAGSWRDSDDRWSRHYDKRGSYQERYCNHIAGPYARRGWELPYFCKDEEPDPEAPTLDFDADPTELLAGATTTLTWESENADSCEASDGWSGDKDVDGSEVVTVDEDTTYTLTCTGEGGEVTESVAIDVTDDEPEDPTVSISADPDEVAAGATTTLTWDSEHADSCEASDGWSGDKALSGSEEVTLGTSTATFTITCTGEGGSDAESVTVTVEEPAPDAPTVTISADPATTSAGGTTTVSWSTTDATSCEAEDSWDGTRATSGDEIVTVGESDETYTLTCTGPGGSDTESVVVGIESPDPEPSVDHLLISEVLYDPDTGQGAESTNEWVELYNPTDSPVDLVDWEIGDGSSNDVISDSSLILEAGAYLVITNATTTADFWDFTGVAVVFLESPITSLGLANGSDSVKLFDAADAEVDAVSYGIDTSAFDPAAPDVSPGSTLWRSDLGVDTDTAADWSENETPSPGS